MHNKDFSFVFCTDPREQLNMRQMMGELKEKQVIAKQDEKEVT